MVRAVLVAALLMSTTAQARPTEDPKRAEAREHYEAGLARFNLREYDSAIAEFEAAYRLRPDPVFLYNLAQANRLGDHPEQAIHFYRAFLRANPHAPNRHEVEQRIADGEKLLAAKSQMAHPPDHTLEPTEHAAEPSAPPSATPLVVAPAQSPALDLKAPPPKPLYKKWWLWTTVAGVVVAGAAVGLAVGLTTSSSFNANLGTYQGAAK
jgi:iron complex outermembrane receptor protein